MTVAFRLGKLAARYDTRTLRLADYMVGPIGGGALPGSFDYGSRVPNWPKYRNDILNDCTCAAVGHLIQVWTSYLGRPLTPTDDQILDTYEVITGYRSSDPSSDKGATKLAVLNYWRRNAIAGFKIQAYLSLEPGNEDAIKEAIFQFGGAYIGLKLPMSARYQLRNPLSDTLWSVPSGGPVSEGLPESWGGHSVPIVAYDQRTLTVVSWGERLRMTWRFFDVYCDEAYVLLSDAWMRMKPFPSGFEKEQLWKDLAAVTY